MDRKKSWKEILPGGLTEAGSSEKFKTGDWRARFPVHSKDICINCMICHTYCPEDCFGVDGDKLVRMDYDFCKGCGVCAQVCPVKAIEMFDETKFDDYTKNPSNYERKKGENKKQDNNEK